MRAISKIFNIVTSIVITIQLALIAYLMIFTYNLGNILSDKQNLKDWLTDQQVKEAYVEYIVDNFYSVVETPFSGLINEELSKKLMEDHLAGEAFDEIVDPTVDTIYDWLEGRSDNVKIETSSEDILKDLGFINDLYDEKLGVFSDIIDPTDIIKLSDSLNIIDLEQLSANNIPYLYQQLLTLPKKLLIVCVVLSALLILSNRSWRYGFFLIGLSLTLGPLYTLFGYKYLPFDSIININQIRENMSIPSLEELPSFITLIFNKASSMVISITNKHAVIMLVVGILIIAISQLAIREKVIEEDDDELDVK